MALAIPHLDLSPGQVICLHVPHGFHQVTEAVMADVARIAEREGKSAKICRSARGRTGLRELFRKQRSGEWLAREAKIPKAEAARVIAASPIRVWDIMGCNAGTPRCFLGIAAGICQRPAVIVYSTGGLDPRGRATIHEYVVAWGRDLCAVHVSLPTILGDGTPAQRMCPLTGRCVELRPVG